MLAGIQTVTSAKSIAASCSLHPEEREMRSQDLEMADHQELSIEAQLATKRAILCLPRRLQVTIKVRYSRLFGAPSSPVWAGDSCSSSPVWAPWLKSVSQEELPCRMFQ